MDVGRILGRGFSFPPRLGPSGRFAWSEGTQNIRESIEVVLLTEFQERVMLPEFGGGLRSFLFEPNIPGTHRLIEDRARRALANWEPRIQVEDLKVEPDLEDPEAATLTVAYKLVATGEAEAVSLTLLLAG